MPKTPKVVAEPTKAEFDLEEWFSDNHSDELDDEFEDQFNAEFLHGINSFINSGIELTKVIVAAEQHHGKKLNAESILAIFEQAMEKIGRGTAVLTQDL